MSLPKQVARNILPLVNSDAFDMLMEYVEYRREQLHKELESVSPEELKALQGALSELRKIVGLRAEAQESSK